MSRIPRCTRRSRRNSAAACCPNSVLVNEVENPYELSKTFSLSFQESGLVRTMRQIDYDYIHRLSRLIDQYDHVQRFGESARALSAFQDTMAMEAMRQSALAVERMQWLGESTRLALSAFQDTMAMEAMRQSAFTVERMQRLGESTRLALSAFQDTMAMEAMRQSAFTVERMQRLGESTRLALSAFQDTMAMEAIQELSNTPFIDLCIYNGMVPHSCFDPDRIPLAMQSSIVHP